MSTPKFTLGPWKVDDIVWSEDERTHISISAPNGACVGGSIILDEANVEALTEQELTANAHLIAAAPEMYEALKAILEDNCFYHKASDERAWKLLNASTAKAEGRQA